LNLFPASPPAAICLGEKEKGGKAKGDKILLTLFAFLLIRAAVLFPVSIPGNGPGSFPLTGQGGFNKMISVSTKLPENTIS
jgi:hypothetical protein